MMPPSIETDDPVIQADGVSVRYVLSHERPRTLQEYLIGASKGNLPRSTEFWALSDVSFAVGRGRSLGIIGPNGSGKSTLLKVISGIIKPSLGSVYVRGKIAPLIELGAGFDSELTGKENIYLNGAILGLAKREIDRKFDRIVEFSEVGNFIHSPLRTYSSGMLARLGFSVAVEVEADILAVDEVLSVGDEGFNRKCHKKIDEMMVRGVTLLFVSHSIGEVQRLCESALWLEGGKKVALGESDIVSRRYLLHFDKTVFADIPEGDPRKRHIDVMFLRGITSGYTINGRRYYNPENKVSRAEFAVFLSKALGMKGPGSRRQIFSDVPETHWASGHIAWVFEQGVIDGVRSDTGSLFFNPDDYVTAEDLAGILSKIDSEKCLHVVPRGSHLINRGEMAKILYEFFDLEKSV